MSEQVPKSPNLENKIHVTLILASLSLSFAVGLIIFLFISCIRNYRQTRGARLYRHYWSKKTERDLEQGRNFMPKPYVAPPPRVWQRDEIASALKDQIGAESSKSSSGSSDEGKVLPKLDFSKDNAAPEAAPEASTSRHEPVGHSQDPISNNNGRSCIPGFRNDDDVERRRAAKGKGKEVDVPKKDVGKRADKGKGKEVDVPKKDVGKRADKGKGKEVEGKKKKDKDDADSDLTHFSYEPDIELRTPTFPKKATFPL
jgi:putative transposon-encoded protein